MRAEEIKKEVLKIKKKYGTCDPEEICDAMHIRVSRMPMGTHEKSCKGFFLVNARCKQAVINDDLDDLVQRIILPHELGHGVLHLQSGINAFHELTYLDETNIMELEANTFAAEFLLDDVTLFEAIAEQLNFFQTASLLRVPPELLDFKLRLLRREGHSVNPLYIAQSDFLKRNIGRPKN